ncbi:MAG: hypothetical protein KA712_02145 [Myxococcales bacterium]|nr:hypothetical protein [Myxococcales bacterium]
MLKPLHDAGSTFPFLSCALLLAVVPMASGCPSGDGLDPFGPDGCTYEGVAYRAGDGFPASDGCNTCSCGADGLVACTLIACLGGGGGAGGKSGPSGCTSGGKVHAVGESFPSPDGCNTCSCQADGSVACTEKACLPPGTCVRGGCSGQLCVETTAPSSSTCEYRPEYACYQMAVCERQADGQCGFTSSAALTQCLANAKGSACTYAGATYQEGESFAATDGCNTCVCGRGGSAACTKRACPVPACDFKASYEYGDIGGLRIFADRSFLAPGNSYRHQRQPFRSDMPFLSCEPALPECGALDVVTALDIERDLGHPHVQLALSKVSPPIYGRDTRPVDGTLFEFLRSDGRGFLVGADCPDTSSSCQAIPAGIKQLRDRLRALDKAQLASAACQQAGF